MQNDNNHKNLAAAILENGGYSSDTSLTIPTTSAATFPDVPFFATIMPTTDLANSNNSEIVEVTATSTSGSDTTFTISRGQRGTTAINWDAGKAVLVHAIYTEDVVYIDTTLSTPTNIAYVSEDNIQNGAVTTSKIANGAVTSQNIDWTTLGYAEILMESSQNITASQTTLQFSTIGSQSGSIVSGISSNKISLAPGVYLLMCQVFWRWNSTPSSSQEIILRLKKNNDSTLICNSVTGAVSGLASAGPSVFGIVSISSGDNIFATIAPQSSGVAEYSSKQTRLEIVRIG